MKTALILAGPSEQTPAGRLKSLLAGFGVECVQSNGGDLPPVGGNAKYCVVASSRSFLDLCGAIERGNTGAAEFWRSNVHSAFVFAGNDPASLLELTNRMTSGAAASFAEVKPGSEWVVSGKSPEFCKSMSGIRVPVAIDGSEMSIAFDKRVSMVDKIISGASGMAFWSLGYRSVPLFLSTGDIIDVNAGLSGRHFDVRSHFLPAVPIVLYVKWALAEECWQPAESCACLVVDDPLLRPRYGHLDFSQLAGLSARMDFAASIAFIPWNWKRSAKDTVRLFQDNSERLSLSIHGCDHTGGEFGSHNLGRLAWKSRQSIQRMLRHQSRTGLSFDRVMVFPQGVFSETAMAVLKHHGFIGVVNSEVVSNDRPQRTVRISDSWDAAVMNYCDFPIFSRRYPGHGLENFAFDLLLGKPCIVVMHHHDCHDKCRHTGKFIEDLKMLKVDLRWCSLAEVVRRSFRRRERTPDEVEVEMYGSEVYVENRSARKKVFRLRKRESAPSTIEKICAESETVPWTASGNHVLFEIGIGPGEGKTVKIIFKKLVEDAFEGEGSLYRMKVLLRRYCCEVRDNYAR